jgi:hypothetical protein
MREKQLLDHVSHVLRVVGQRRSAAIVEMEWIFKVHGFIVASDSHDPHLRCHGQEWSSGRDARRLAFHQQDGEPARFHAQRCRRLRDDGLTAESYPRERRARGGFAGMRTFDRCSEVQ